MSWKAVEMQVALPRTQDVGRMQAEQQKQGEHLQGALAQTRQQQEEIKRTQVSNSEESAKIKKDKDEKTEEQTSDGQKFAATQDEVSIEHPYLGTNIDLNL